MDEKEMGSEGSGKRDFCDSTLEKLSPRVVEILKLQPLNPFVDLKFKVLPKHESN